MRQVRFIPPATGVTTAVRTYLRKFWGPRGRMGHLILMGVPFGSPAAVAYFDKHPESPPFATQVARHTIHPSATDVALRWLGDRSTLCSPMWHVGPRQLHFYAAISRVVLACFLFWFLSVHSARALFSAHSSGRRHLLAFVRNSSPASHLLSPTFGAPASFGRIRVQASWLSTGA